MECIIFHCFWNHFSRYSIFHHFYCKSKFPFCAFKNFEMHKIKCKINRSSLNSQVNSKKCTIFLNIPKKEEKIQKIFFLLAGQKVHFLTPCKINKSIFWPPPGKKFVCNTGKKFILLVWFRTLNERFRQNLNIFVKF